MRPSDKEKLLEIVNKADKHASFEDIMHTFIVTYYKEFTVTRPETLRTDLSWQRKVLRASPSVATAL